VRVSSAKFFPSNSHLNCPSIKLDSSRREIVNLLSELSQESQPFIISTLIKDIFQFFLIFILFNHQYQHLRWTDAQLLFCYIKPNYRPSLSVRWRFFSLLWNVLKYPSVLRCFFLFFVSSSRLILLFSLMWNFVEEFKTKYTETKTWAQTIWFFQVDFDTLPYKLFRIKIFIYCLQARSVKVTIAFFWCPA